jgi:hypothetical protein
MVSLLSVRPMEHPIWNFEQEPSEESLDETGILLRAYFDRMDDEKMVEYSPEWTDKQLMAWDGSFPDDGNLMILCPGRHVDIVEYRQVLEQAIEYRNRVRPLLKW